MEAQDLRLVLRTADGINLTALPFAPAAFASIEAILVPVIANASHVSNATRVDSHCKSTRLYLGQEYLGS